MQFITLHMSRALLPLWLVLSCSAPHTWTLAVPRCSTVELAKNARSSLQQQTKRWSLPSSLVFPMKPTWTMWQGKTHTHWLISPIYKAVKWQTWWTFSCRLESCSESKYKLNSNFIVLSYKSVLTLQPYNIILLIVFSFLVSSSFFLVCVSVWDRVLLCNPEWPGSHISPHRGLTNYFLIWLST